MNKEYCAPYPRPKNKAIAYPLIRGSQHLGWGPLTF